MVDNDILPVDAAIAGKRHDAALMKQRMANYRPHIFGVTADWLPERTQAIDKGHNGARQQTGILDRIH